MHLKRALSSAVATVTVLLLAVVAHAPVDAHVICGNRVFPATLTMDDPGVGDELSLPTFSLMPTPQGENNVYAYEWDKTITQHLGIAINGDYISQPNAHLSGWDNTAITIKDELPCIESGEIAWSIGVVRLLPGTGASQLRNAGAIGTVGSTAPTFYIGKGFGASPTSWVRPFAITGEFSRAISDNPVLSPGSWSYAASLQYSMPYMQQHIKALKLPQWITRLTPIVEVAMNSPDGGRPTGTIAPGILYSAQSWQLGVEAILPANGMTRQLQGTGVLLQFHLFLDDLAWKTFWGKPLIR